MSGQVTRRSALVAAAALGVGAVAGFAYGRNNDARKGPSTGAGAGYGATPGGSGAGAALASLSDVPAGGGLITDGVVITRTGGDTVKAFSAACTHLGCSVNKVSDGKIFCPCHGSVFDAATGAVVQGPASSPLPPVAVTVRDGEVFTA